LFNLRSSSSLLTLSHISPIDQTIVTAKDGFVVEPDFTASFVAIDYMPDHVDRLTVGPNFVAVGGNRLGFFAAEDQKRGHKDG